MPGDIFYLSLDDVIELHDIFCEQTGSPHSPLTDRNKLESALSRPRNAAFYEGADLVAQACILAIGISQAQAFMDGNKRAAFATADVFLRFNGHAFSGDPLAFAERLERVATVSKRDRDFETVLFTAWVHGHVAAIEDPIDSP